MTVLRVVVTYNEMGGLLAFCTSVTGELTPSRVAHGVRRKWRNQKGVWSS
jgi:hypothetical protein